MDYRDFWKPLVGLYEENEAKSIARLVLESAFGLDFSDILIGRTEMLPEPDLKSLQQRLMKGEPVQYVLGEAQFFGRCFHVAPGVLIPRPETEELCRHIVEQWTMVNGPHGVSILDIGTGSGCIACTLAAELPFASVTAWDISKEALNIASENAKRVHVDLSFEQVDILVPCPPPPVPWNVIVSNPPYVCEEEKAQMEPHVLNYEPHEALFVPDDDPLCFYRAIGNYAINALKPGGLLFFELNSRFAQATASLLAEMGYKDVKIIKDQYGKDRFIKTCK